ncbi:hypothetical protein BSL78_02809 [Apostichopus japonicus]|uniref:Protein prenyltransferase alpha subunit repeat-containing protein 1 n=1 Tax=Stichopus japonicus TaxID=307972 RepID=A0A2G8LJ16_STIJA|nr:hypothetical protein BSL78_02809 [Apostichopus japonicus]
MAQATSYDLSISTIDYKSKLQEYSKVALLLNPECSTFWNIRKELFQRKYFTALTELKFTNIILTCHPKSPETYVHKRWIVRHAFTKQAEGNVDNRIVDTDEQTQTALDTEMEGSRVAASGYPSNYNAWSHRIWTVKALARCSAEVLESELENTKSWVRQHVSDHSGLQYRQFLLSEHRQKCLLEEHLLKEFQFLDDLLISYPGHEALWNHRRALYHLAVQSQEGLGHQTEELSTENASVKSSLTGLEDPIEPLGAGSLVEENKSHTGEGEGVRLTSINEMVNPLLEKKRALAILEETSTSDSKIQERHYKLYIQWLDRFKT